MFFLSFKSFVDALLEMTSRLMTQEFTKWKRFNQHKDNDTKQDVKMSFGFSSANACIQYTVYDKGRVHSYL